MRNDERPRRAARRKVIQDRLAEPAELVAGGRRVHLKVVRRRSPLAAANRAAPGSDRIGDPASCVTAAIVELDWARR